MRKNEVLKVLWLMVVVVVVAIFAAPGMDASARSSRKVLAKYKLSATKKTMREGQTYTISLKGVSKKAKSKKLKWTTGNKQVVSISKKSGSKAVLRAKKAGKATIKVTYKGKTYKCKVTVKKKKDKKDDAENAECPTLNATEVELHYTKDYAVPYIGKNPANNYSFQFKVLGTQATVKSWSLEGDKKVKTRYLITDDGTIKMRFGNDIDEAYSECTVKAHLSDGTELTARVKGYDDITLYVQSVFDKFKETYITDNMTEYEKMDKAAWYLSVEYDYRLYQADWCEYIVTGSGDCMASRYAVMYLCRYLGLRAAACPDLDSHGDTVVRADSRVYLVTTGYQGEKPRYYQIVEMSRELFDKRNEKNHINPEYIWGED